MHSFDDSETWNLRQQAMEVPTHQYFPAALINLFKLSPKDQARSDGLHLLQTHCTLIIEWG